jgi:hypothetical protein
MDCVYDVFVSFLCRFWDVSAFYYLHYLIINMSALLVFDFDNTIISLNLWNEMMLFLSRLSSFDDKRMVNEYGRLRVLLRNGQISHPFQQAGISPQIFLKDMSLMSTRGLDSKQYIETVIFGGKERKNALIKLGEFIEEVQHAVLTDQESKLYHSLDVRVYSKNLSEIIYEVIKQIKWDHLNIRIFGQECFSLNSSGPNSNWTKHKQMSIDLASEIYTSVMIVDDDVKVVPNLVSPNNNTRFFTTPDNPDITVYTGFDEGKGLLTMDISRIKTVLFNWLFFPLTYCTKKNDDSLTPGQFYVRLSSETMTMQKEYQAYVLVRKLDNLSLFRHKFVLVRDKDNSLYFITTGSSNKNVKMQLRHVFQKFLKDMTYTELHEKFMKPLTVLKNVNIDIYDDVEL